MNIATLGCLKRYIEINGVTTGAAEAAGITKQAFTRWARTPDGQLLVSQWLAVWRLRNFRTSPEYTEKAFKALGEALDGPVETKKKEIGATVMDLDGFPIIGEDGNPLIEVKSIETQTIRHTPQPWAVKMILGGDAPTPKSVEVVDPPMVQIIGDIDESI